MSDPTTNALWTDDAFLQSVVANASTDPEIEGVILGGSRGAGVADAESDYDLEWVLSDAAYDRRIARGEPQRLPADPAQPLLDGSYTCLRELALLPTRAAWAIPGYTTARILYDRTGQVTAAVRALVTIAPERARDEVLGWFDAYLNAFYRSLKAWRRGNVLGAQLQAAESVMHLVRVLFALEQRWPPYHDRLVGQLDTLAQQGWPPGYLHEVLLRLVQTGDPTLQQEVEAQVENLLRARGFEVNLWDGTIDRVKAWKFNACPIGDGAAGPTGS
jgi:hypothetical protein